MYEGVAQCAHCKRMIGEQTIKHELSFSKDGAFRVTYKYRICDRCYTLYNVAKQVVKADEFPKFKSDFVGEYEERVDTEKTVYDGISKVLSFVTPCEIVGPENKVKVQVEHIDGILDA